MISEFKDIISKLNMKELTDKESATIKYILNYKLDSCVSDFFISCIDCPFNKRYGGYGCISNYINNKSGNRYSLYILSEILNDYINENREYWR